MMRTTTEEEKCLSIREGKRRSHGASSSGTYRVRHRLIFLKKNKRYKEFSIPCFFSIYSVEKEKKIDRCHVGYVSV